MCVISSFKSYLEEIEVLYEEEAEEEPGDDDPEDVILGLGKIHRNLARLKLFPGGWMLSVSGLAAPCFQLYCCVLKAPHMFLSNESTWPRAFTVWHCANAGGLIRPNSKAAIAACEDEGDEICVCKREAAAQSCQSGSRSWFCFRRLVIRFAFPIPNTNWYKVRSEELFMSLLYSWESLLGQMPDWYGYKCGDWLDVEAVMI